MSMIHLYDEPKKQTNISDEILLNLQWKIRNQIHFKLNLTQKDSLKLMLNTSIKKGIILSKTAEIDELF